MTTLVASAVDLIPGRATPEATQTYAKRSPHAFRTIGGLHLSSLGLGSYLGDTSPGRRASTTQAALVALQGGINVLDTASNYREQASERDLGKAIRAFVDDGGDRDAVFVASKAGFLHGDSESELGKEWFTMEYSVPRIVEARDILDNVHCMTPKYVLHELARSRHNLGLETLDVYFLHNPEALFANLDEADALDRLQACFHALEDAVDAGHIRAYGIATWQGLRIPPGTPGHIPLVKLVHLAGVAAQAKRRRASEHRFRAVQLPVNLAMPEAILHQTQAWKFGEVPALEAIDDVGMLCLGSASLAQTRLHVPDAWKEALGTDDDLRAALRFARGVKGVHVPLVGSGDPAHVAQLLDWLEDKPDPGTVGLMLGPGGPHG